MSINVFRQSEEFGYEHSLGSSINVFGQSEEFGYEHSLRTTTNVFRQSGSLGTSIVIIKKIRVMHFK